MAPPNKYGNGSGFPPPPNHQPARQLDQIVGNRPLRIRTNIVRTSAIVEEFTSAQATVQLELRLGNKAQRITLLRSCERIMGP